METGKAGLLTKRSAISGRATAALLLIPLVGAALLFGSIPGRSLWIDELYTLQVAGEQSLSGVVQHAILTERRPPLDYIAVHLWSSVAGPGEATQRALSVFWLLLALPLVFFLGRRLAGTAVGWWSVALMAGSPFLLLYGPMVRAYTLTLFLGCLATLLLLRWIDRPGLGSSSTYFVVALALIYTDYVGLSLLVAHAALVTGGRRELPWRQMALVWVILAVAYVPWLGVVLGQTGRVGTPADLAHSLPGYALKIAYPLFSFGLGETILPWRPFALAGIAALVVAVAGALAFWRARKPEALTLVACGAIPLGFTIFLLSTFASDITFLNVASRTILSVPYVYILLAGGLAGGLGRARWAAAGLLAIAWLASSLNLFAGVDYHNPIYAVPMRQIAQRVVADSGPDELVIADPDTVFDYYAKLDGDAPPVRSSTAEDTLPAVKAAPPAGIWTVTFGRDRTRDLAPVDLIAWLDQTYGARAFEGYVRQDPVYGRVKQLLLGREAYEYKMLLSHYEAPRR